MLFFLSENSNQIPQRLYISKFQCYNHLANPIFLTCGGVAINIFNCKAVKNCRYTMCL